LYGLMLSEFRQDISFVGMAGMQWLIFELRDEIRLGEVGVKGKPTFL